MRPSIGLSIVLLAGAMSIVTACGQESAAPQKVASAGVSVDNGGGFDASVGSGTGTGGSGPVTLASGLVSPRAIVLGPSTVYWTTSQVASVGALVGDASAGTGGIESVPRAGGARAEVIDGLTSPRNIVLEGTTLFFAEAGPTGGLIDAYLLGNTAVTPLASTAAAPLPLVVDEGILYWAGSTAGALAVHAAPVSSHDVSTVASLGADAGDLSPVAMTTIGTTLYLLAKGTDGASILQVESSGGTPKSIWHDASLIPSDLASAGTSLYWIASGSAFGGQVLGMGASGGAVVTLASNLDNPAKLAVDGDEVYFTTSVADGSVLAVSTGGGGVQTLASGLDYPFAVAVDDAVYFTTATTVGRVAR